MMTYAIPAITATINMAFAETADFENDKLIGAKFIQINPNTDGERYLFLSDYYGMFMDCRMPGGVIRFCFGSRGIDEIFLINENKISKRVYIKIRYGKRIEDAYITARNARGEHKSVHFNELPEELRNSLIELNAKQTELETALNQI